MLVLPLNLWKPKVTERMVHRNVEEKPSSIESCGFLSMMNTSIQPSTICTSHVMTS